MEQRGGRPAKQVALALAALAASSAPAPAQSWLPSSFFPPWSSVQPLRTINISYDTGRSQTQNGALLASAVAALLPGDRLLIGPGTYSIQARFEVLLQGTAARPIWIEASDPSQKPVITRPNGLQNAINVGRGSGGQSRYLALRNLEVRGGDDLIRLYDCHNIWIDQCYIHDGLGIGISANANDTSRLYLTRNEIARPGTATAESTGEGMYLGANNNGDKKMSWSVVALNHVHDTQVANPPSSYQGDGIEVKHGSHHNWIVENHVARTHFPCIVVYGTGSSSAPNGENVVERNLMYDSRDYVLQVRGDAIVRNNVAIYSRSSANAGFQSAAIQGPVRKLRFVHNTVINPGRAANLRNWHSGSDMVLANNVCYSRDAEALRFNNGSSGVLIAGNVVLGTVVGASSGYVLGSGLSDFVGVTWTATQRDVTPVIGSVVDNHGVWSFSEPMDLRRAPRFCPADPGAVENPLAALASTQVISTESGGRQDFTLAAGSAHAGRSYWLVGTMTGVAPASRFGSYDLPLVMDPYFTLTLTPNTAILSNTLGVLNVQGQALNAAFVLPPAPGLNLRLWHAFTVWDASSNLVFVSNPVPLLLQ